jgi:hypothetical protein
MAAIIARTDQKDLDTRRPLTKDVLSSFSLESRFYAVLSKAASSGLASNHADRSPGKRNGQKAAKVLESAERIEMAFLRLAGYIMNEFTDKNEEAFLDACGAIGVEPDAKVNTLKKRYLVSEFLKNPVSWLETEILYHSYTTRGEAQEVANGIDRMISEGAPVAQSKFFPRPKHSSALSDTALGS